MSPLWSHQKEAITRASDGEELGLFFEMGTGKTRTIVEILKRKFYENKSTMRTLILCPPVVLKNWVNEFKMFSEFDERDIVVLDRKTRKEKGLQDRIGNSTREFILITNYEALDNIEFSKLLEWWAPEILVCDESQRLKSSKSKRAKAVERLSWSTEYRYILSGTPVLNSPMDLYQQFKILDKGKTFGANFWVFCNRYFFDANASNPNFTWKKWLPKPETFMAFNKLIGDKSMRVQKSECLDLPPFIREKREVELSPAQAVAYKSMKKEFIAFVESEKKSDKSRTVVAQLAITKALRLQQIITGFVTTEEGEQLRLKGGNPRLKELEELIKEITATGEKVIIWACFKENYKQIAEVCDKLHIGYAELHGGIQANQKDKNINSFKTNKDCQVLIANQGAGGVGVNLQEASYSIYFSRNFNLEHDLQSEARNYRGGSEMHSSVTRIDLVAVDTIDQQILDALLKKQKISDMILDWDV